MSAPPAYSPRPPSPSDSEPVLLAACYGVCERCGVAGRVQLAGGEWRCPLCAGHEELDAIADRHGEQARVYRHVSGARRDVARDFADRLRRTLASLTGEALDPPDRQEDGDA